MDLLESITLTSPPHIAEYSCRNVAALRQTRNSTNIPPLAFLLPAVVVSVVVSLALVSDGILFPPPLIYFLSILIISRFLAELSA